MSTRSKLFLPVVATACFSIFATIHALTIDDLQQYRESFLIPVEFFLLIASAMGALAVLVGAFLFVFRKRWASAVFALISFVSTAALITFGVSIDQATLIYMT